MTLLVTSQLRFVTHAPWSAATALLGVALGVASVVAVHLIGAQVVRSLEATAPPHLAGTTHVLERPGMDSAAYFDLRERWRRQPQSPLQALVPVVEGHAALGPRQVLVLGVDWLAMPRPRAAAPAEPVGVSSDVLVGEAVLADASLGVAVDDWITVSGRSYRVAGVRDTGLGAALVTDIAAAQHMLRAGPGAVHRLALTVADPWRPWRRRLDHLMPGFAAGLPQPRALELPELLPEVGTGRAWTGWRALPVAAQRPSAEFARAVLFNLGALGTLALLVAWFLIYQVGVIWLRRQRLLLERLHAVGVSRRALRRSFLTVFLAMGALATLLGVAAGIGLAAALVHLASRGVDPGSSIAAGFTLDLWVLGKGVASGLGVCLLGGVGAFASESRQRPWSPWWGRVLGPLLVAVTAGGILAEASGVLGGFLAIFAMSAAVVALVSPLLALLRRVVLATGGPLSLRLALRDVVWHPRVLTVAIAALSLAVATSIGVALMVESFRLDFDRMLAVRLAGDLYVEAGPADAGEATAWLQGQPGVTRVSASGRDRLRVQGIPVELGYGRFDTAESARYGFPRPLAPGEALVSERLARDLGAGPGDVLEAGGGKVTVVGVFPGFGDAMGRLLVDVGSLARLGVAPRFDRLAVTLGPGAGPVAGLSSRLTERFPLLRVEGRGELRELALRIFDRTFAITRALTLLALAVAVVGTYNALTALRLQQGATTALLRAEGMTARRVRGIALIRAGTVGGFAAALALPLGLAMAWTLCAVINPRSFGWTVDLHLPLSGWLVPLLLGMLAAVLAGVLPAPRERGTLHESG